MDWTALFLSLQLAVATILVLIPLALFTARRLAYSRFRGKAVVEALLAVPLVLPPTAGLVGSAGASTTVRSRTR